MSTTKPTLPGTFVIKGEAMCGEKPQIKLTWTISATATSYDIYRNGLLLSKGVLGTTFVNTTISPKTNYIYHIEARSSRGKTKNTNGTITVRSLDCNPTVPGPATHPPSALVLKALEFAKLEIGTVELPGNKGPKIKAYLNTVGLNEGYSWCAAFVYWCFNQSAYILKVPNPLIKTGGVLKHWNLTKGVKIKVPRPGDIFILEFNGGLGHTGIVKTVDLVLGTYTTVEGNSNAAGSRTGGMVCSNTRKIALAKGFIRY